MDNSSNNPESTQVALSSSTEVMENSANSSNSHSVVPTTTGFIPVPELQEITRHINNQNATLFATNVQNLPFDATLFGFMSELFNRAHLNIIQQFQLLSSSEPVATFQSQIANFNRVVGLYQNAFPAFGISGFMYNHTLGILNSLRMNLEDSLRSRNLANLPSSAASSNSSSAGPLQLHQNFQIQGGNSSASPMQVARQEAAQVNDQENSQQNSQDNQQTANHIQNNRNKIAKLLVGSIGTVLTTLLIMKDKAKKQSPKKTIVDLWETIKGM